jgi:hypothetical protein
MTSIVPELGPYNMYTRYLTLSGISLAIIEVSLIILIAYYFKNYKIIIKKLYRDIIVYKKINAFTYYWFVFTIFTGFVWEISFVAQYRDVNTYSGYLIKNNQTVWSNQYSLDYLLPWKFAKIFYGDYGAFADREYMVNTDDWSRIIESTHAMMCATFALLAFVFEYFDKYNDMLVCIGVSMGAQLMNSVLYIAEYVIQMNNPNNVNYPTEEFPAGTLLVYRPFMWVNVFWTVFPLYILVNELLFSNKIKKDHIIYPEFSTYNKYCTNELNKIANNSKNEFLDELFKKQKNNMDYDMIHDIVNMNNGVETRALRKKRLELEKLELEKLELEKVTL